MTGFSTSYPVNISVEPVSGERNRLTVAFRIILAIPHLLLVGGPVFVGFGGVGEGPLRFLASFGSSGVLGAVAFVCAVISWFAILFANQHPAGLRDLTTYYLRWRVRALAYTALLRDEYPPFGDADYPAGVAIPPAPETRNKLSVGLRLIYAIPHYILLLFLGIAWAVTSLIAWFAILFTGNYPEGLYNFALGVFRWEMRVEAYVLLLLDEYPPFSLSE